MRRTIVPASGYIVHQLNQDDLTLMDALLSTFGRAFNEVETYVGNRPGAGYMRRLLGSDYFIALAALKTNPPSRYTRNWDFVRMSFISTFP